MEDMYIDTDVDVDIDDSKIIPKSERWGYHYQKWVEGYSRVFEEWREGIGATEKLDEADHAGYADRFQEGPSLENDRQVDARSWYRVKWKALQEHGVTIFYPAPFNATQDEIDIAMKYHERRLRARVAQRLKEEEERAAAKLLWRSDGGYIKRRRHGL